MDQTSIQEETEWVDLHFPVPLEYSFPTTHVDELWDFPLNPWFSLSIIWLDCVTQKRHKKIKKYILNSHLRFPYVDSGKPVNKPQDPVFLLVGYIQPIPTPETRPSGT